MAKTDDTAAPAVTEGTHKPSIALVEVTLIRPHQHGAELLEAGAKVKVNRRQYQWMLKRGRIKA